MENMNEIILEEYDDNGVIILNQPESLNALTFSMVAKIAAILKKWETKKKLVVIKANGEKAFCSGGDIRSAYKSLKNNESLPFKQQEIQYQIAYLTKNYKIPIVSLTNGITMGAGTALSIYSKYCIATEKTSFAMPEVGIGFLPDVGTTYVFPRLPEKLGLYLALTGQRLTGSDMCRVGLATHFCKSTDLLQLEKILRKPFSNLDEILNEFSVENLPELSLSPVMSKINHCFTATSVEEIFTKLESDSSHWSKNTLKILKKKSPTSLKIAYKQISLGKNMQFTDCLQMEYRVNCIRLKDNDFCEGVRALILDKDFSPQWKPSTLQEVTEEDIEKYFLFVPESKNLRYKL